ncbi:dihydroorotate dehydrogenase electron transfer subunit [Ruminococcaceae bacterium OttesenSCG-928-A16]|nr:dihydroorotate dehydrogenase electron transfer subunit [Ruminococcaceae bacterium OttesenSCG-928-A16]
MTKNAIYTIETNQPIANDVFAMRLAGPTGALVAPGQFVNILLNGFYLRRPISVCDWDEAGMLLIYKILGKGTAQMATMQPGQTLNLLTGLGNGFTVSAATGKPTVLVGGGVGVPPLFSLAKQLITAGNIPEVVLGFRSSGDVFYAEEFAKLGCKVHLATEDGTAGTKGFVTTALQDMAYDYYYTCGPNAMLQAVHALSAQKGAAGQLSFEERMGCGFGACMGCSCHTQVGPKRVCVDGPVFTSEEVVFA